MSYRAHPNLFRAAVHEEPQHNQEDFSLFLLISRLAGTDVTQHLTPWRCTKVETVLTVLLRPLLPEGSQKLTAGATSVGQGLRHSKENSHADSKENRLVDWGGGTLTVKHV